MEKTQRLLREYIKVLLEDGEGGGGDFGGGDAGSGGRMDSYGFTSYADAGTMGKVLFGPFKDALGVIAGESEKSFHRLLLGAKIVLGSAISIIPGININWNKVFSDYGSSISKVDSKYAEAYKNVFSTFSQGSAGIATMMWNPTLFFTAHAIKKGVPASIKAVKNASGLVSSGKGISSFVSPGTRAGTMPGTKRGTKSSAKSGSVQRESRFIFNLAEADEKESNVIELTGEELKEESEKFKKEFKNNVESFLKGMIEVSKLDDAGVVEKFNLRKIVDDSQQEKENKEKSSEDKSKKVASEALQKVSENVLANQVRTTLIEKLNEFTISMKNLLKDSEESLKQLKSKQEQIQQQIPNFRVTGQNELAEFLKDVIKQSDDMKKTFSNKVKKTLNNK